MEQVTRQRVDTADKKQQKLAALQPADTASDQTTEPEQLSPKVMALVLQNELKRMGCDPGKVDGKWGRQGSRALTRFNKYAKLKLPTGKPSMQAINSLRSQKQRICPRTVRQKAISARPKAKAKKRAPGKVKSAAKRQKCKYERRSKCAARVCSFFGRADCGAGAFASYCREGGKFRKKTCR